MSRINSVPGIFGGEDFYDENGQKIGYSVPGLYGGENIRMNDDLFGMVPPDDHGGPDDW